GAIRIVAGAPPPHFVDPAAGARNPVPSGVSVSNPRDLGRVRTSSDVNKLGTFGPALLEQIRARLAAGRSFYASWSKRTALGGFGVDEKTSRGSGNSTTPSRTRRTLPGGTGPARWSSIDGTDKSRS